MQERRLTISRNKGGYEMKKMLRGFALILALTLAATLCIPAFAAEGATDWPEP